MLDVDPHPLLDLRAFVTRFLAPLGVLAAAPPLAAALAPDFAAPVTATDEVRKAVRDLLRHGGFKPTGRSKPASEYLRAAAAEGIRAINAAVDAGNAVSLHSGLPISVVDLALAAPPLRVAVAAPGASYVFNQAGQAIDVGKLLCLHDAAGPCANAVKDAQRTKTTPATTRTLSLIWGTTALPGHADAALAWYRALLAELGAETEPV